MTQTELYDSHCHIPDYGGCRELSVKASIEYAISVLEELLKAEDRHDVFLHDITKAKVKELKLLLK